MDQLNLSGTLEPPWQRLAVGRTDAPKGLSPKPGAPNAPGLGLNTRSALTPAKGQNMNEDDTIPGRVGGLLPTTAVGLPPLPQGRSKKTDQVEAILSVTARVRRLENELGYSEDDDGEEV